MTARPPRWDLSSWFTGFGDAFDRWLDDITDRVAALDARAVALPPLGAKTAGLWEALLLAIEDVSTALQHASAYASARAAADVTDEAAQAATARIASLTAAIDGAEAPVVAALGVADAADFDALCARPALDGAQFWLRRWRTRAARALDPAGERLAADLGVDGLHAWARLYRQITSTITFDIDGERVPLAWLRSELYRPDADRRAKALSGASAALAGQSTVFSAALNGIAGARLTLDRHRGVPDPLDEALFDSAIARETLDAMMGVVAERAGIARRYLRLKARLFGVDALGWSDLRAPLDIGPGAAIDWPEAQAIVEHAFGRHHPDLATFAQQMFAAGHVEAEPRAGKRPGAFCTRSFHAGESRVYMSFTGFGADVRTLAHELGHAWHNHVMRDLRTWARQYPMTLAETASIVAETLVSDAQLANPEASDAARLALLDARLGQVAIYLLDIPTRLTFERAYYAERAKGEVPAERACALMAEAQREIFGDALDPDGVFPWFWAEKLHFFLSGRRFYNFPYTFGFLFGQGVLARARSVGVESFHPTYVELLRQTGRGSVEEVAHAALGVDLGARDFWSAALDGAEADLAAFEALVEARLER